MDIKHLNDYVEMKKDIVGTGNFGNCFLEKKVALHNMDGQTHVITEYESGYYILKDGNWELCWNDKKVNAWNKKQGLTKDDVEDIINFSMSGNNSNSLAVEKIDHTNSKRTVNYEFKKVSYLEQLKMYKSKGLVLDTYSHIWKLSKSKQKDRPPR